MDYVTIRSSLFSIEPVFVLFLGWKEKKEIAWLITGNPLFLGPYYVGFRNLKESLLGAIPVSIQHYTITIYYKKKNNPDSVLEMNKKKKKRIMYVNACELLPFP